MHKLIMLILSSMAAVTCLAQAGTHSFEMLSAHLSAYGIASAADNVSSHRDEINLSQYNPSLLQPGCEREAAFSFANYLGSVNTFNLAYCQSAGEMQAWSAYAHIANYGAMDGRDEYGTEIGEFKPIDAVIGGDYSRMLAKNFTVGIGLKFIYSQIEEYKAFGFGFDVGANYYDPEKKVSASLVGRNIGAMLSQYSDADGSRDRLPFNLAIGVSKTLAHAPFTFHVTYSNLNHWDLSYHKSGETEKSITDTDKIKEEIEVKAGDMLFRHLAFSIDIHPVKSFVLTAGYNHRHARENQLVDSRTGAGFSFGLLVEVRKVSVGAAYALGGKASNTFGATVRYRIGERIERVSSGPIYPW